MKKKIKYTDNPEVGELRVVKDFLPPAAELADAEVIVHEDIALPEKTIRLLQKKAKESKQDYASFIRSILEQAARRFS